MHYFKRDRLISTLQPHRYPTLPHPRFGLLNRVLAVVEDTRRQHRVSAADAHTVSQVVEVAHAA